MHQPNERILPLHIADEQASSECLVQIRQIPYGYPLVAADDSVADDEWVPQAPHRSETEQHRIDAEGIRQQTRAQTIAPRLVEC
jgi:hypothetical protein